MRCSEDVVSGVVLLEEGVRSLGVDGVEVEEVSVWLGAGGGQILVFEHIESL